MKAAFEFLANPIGASCILALAMILALLLMLSGDVHLRRVALVIASVMIGWIGFFVPTETDFAVMLGLMAILCMMLVLLGRRRRVRAAAFVRSDDMDTVDAKNASGEHVRLTVGVAGIEIPAGAN